MVGAVQAHLRALAFVVLEAPSLQVIVEVERWASRPVVVEWLLQVVVESVWVVAEAQVPWPLAVQTRSSELRSGLPLE